MAVTKHKINAVVKVEHDLLFDHNNPNFAVNSEYNTFYVAMQQNFFNDVLQAQGYLFLNDVLKSLGFPQTSGGTFIGWVKGLSSVVRLDIVESHSRGILHTGILIRHNAKDNVLVYLEESA